MITTLGQFLNSMGVESRIFDMGRHINEISANTFHQFEDGAIAYPSPYLHSAWFGLLFWYTETPDTPLLWFLKFPLDEQGKINPHERDLFLKQLMTAVGTNIQAVKDGERINAVLENNPFTFTPIPEHQATIYARVRLLLQQPPSSFYPGACDYLESDLKNWDALGVQGLADIAVRWPEHQQALISAIEHLPTTPLISLCHCLENETINEALAMSLFQRLETALSSSEESDNQDLAANLICGLSHSSDLMLRHKAISLVLNTEAAKSVEVLAAIASRCSQDFLDPELCLSFLEALAKQDQQAFNHIVADLLFLPRLRMCFIAQFQSSQRSDTLAAAIEGLMAQYQQPPDTPLH